MSEILPELFEWAIQQLPADTYTCTSVCQTHYSAVWRLDGKYRFYLKKYPEGLAREPDVIGLLASQRNKADPVCAPQLLADNRDLHCFITEDAGAPLRTYLRATGDILPLAQALTAYAHLQRTSEALHQNLLALGVPDWQPTKLPALFHSLWQDPAYFAQPDRITETLQEVLLGRITTICGKLASLPIPCTLEHADFHDNNILLSPQGPSVIDWGECIFTHPFFSLHNILFSSSIHHDWSDNHPAQTILREAYLRQWQKSYAAADIALGFQLTKELAPAYKALTYQQLSRACGDTQTYYWTRNILPLMKKMATSV